jgi:hypothetical protein
MLGGNVWLYRLVRKRLGVDACVFPLMKMSDTSAAAITA